MLYIEHPSSARGTRSPCAYIQHCTYVQIINNSAVTVTISTKLFQNCPKFKNFPKVGGGRVNSNWEIDPNFLDILFWQLPLFYLIEALLNTLIFVTELVAKLSFNFNFNLVGSWDSLILNFSSHPPPPTPVKVYFGQDLTWLNWIWLNIT